MAVYYVLQFLVVLLYGFFARLDECLVTKQLRVSSARFTRVGFSDRVLSDVKPQEIIADVTIVFVECV